MGIEAVVFDMDGIIFDSEKLVVKCWQVVADKYGIKGIEDACYKCLGLNRIVTKEIFLEIYGQDFPYDEYKQEMSDLFHKEAAGGNLPKKPGIEKLLAFLKEAGLKLAVASSTRRVVVEKELSEGGLIDYFDAVIAGDMVERSKPEPDIFLKACEVLNVLPANAFVIEDSYNGIRAAKRAGMRTIMVPDMVPDNDEMRELSEIVLENHFEVKNYIENRL